MTAPTSAPPRAVAGSDLIYLGWCCRADGSSVTGTAADPGVAVAALGLLLTFTVKEPVLVGLGAVAGVALYRPW